MRSWPDRALFLTQHALYHVEEFMAIDLLFVMDLAGELVAPRAVIGLLFDRALKDHARMTHRFLEFLELLRCFWIAPWYAAADRT